MHTPGPWHVSGVVTSDRAHLHIGAPDSPMVLASMNFHHIDSNSNARLIAAAPDLLAALKSLMSNHCPLTGDPTHEQLVEHWEYEKSQGNGEAEDMLFALAALKKAENDN